MAVVDSALVVELRANASSAPTEFRLFALGQNKTSKGTFILDAAGLDSILAAHKDQGNDLAFDYEHQAFTTASNGQPAPAAGWFSIEARSDGLWVVNARWTDVAARMIGNKEYRYFSPAFTVDKANRITRLMNVALTNLPASKEMQALIAASQTASTPKEHTAMPNVAALIGLKDDAPEGEVEGRVVALGQTEKDLLSITGKPTVAEAMAVVVFANDNVVKLAAAEKVNAEWAARFATDAAVSEEAAERAMFAEAFAHGQVGRENEDLIGKLKTIRASQGLEGLKLALDILPKRAVRLHQAPRPAGDAEIEKLRQYNAIKAANPDMDPVAAAIASQRGGR